MKIYKKIISLLLVFTMLITLFSSNALFGSVEAATSGGVIEEIDVSVKNSNRVIYLDNSGNESFGITKQDDGTTRVGFWPTWDTFKSDSSTAAPSATMNICNSKGEAITIDEGYKYAINVTYTLLKNNKSSEIGLGYNGKDGKMYVLDYDEFAETQQSTDPGRYILSAFVNGTEDCELRLGFGGSGIIVLESIKIQRVSTDVASNIVNVTYSNEDVATKEFSDGTLKTPEAAYAVDSVFGGWYTDSSFTTKATTASNNATYYAKWLSVTRKIDLSVSNRMADYNDGGTDDTTLKLTTNPHSETITVVSNVANKAISAGGSLSSEREQQISLEYYDLEPAAKQDGYYGGYVSFKANKWYVINVDYSVTAATTATSLMIFANNTNLSTGKSLSLGAKSTTYDSANYVTGAGDYTLYTELKSGGLIDCTYGGASAGHKIRLGFYGKGTFVIKSVTIQEIDKSVESLPVYYMYNGTKFKAAAVNDGGEWKINEPLIYGEYWDKVFDGWYTNDTATTKMTTPTSLSTYYPKWMTITRKVDLKNINRMNSFNAGQDTTKLQLTNATDTTPATVVVNDSTSVSNFGTGSTNNIPSGTDAGRQQISLEYFDFDTAVQDAVYGGYAKLEANKSYAINVDYTVTKNSGSSYIILASNASNISNNAATKYINKNTHTSTGEGLLFAQYSAGNLINGGYGQTAAGDKLRLAFYGNATFVINSITIQEIWTADQTTNAVGLQYVDGGKTYKGAAVNTADGWKWPTPQKNNVKGNVISAEFETWCTDTALTTPATTPTLKATYYARYSPITRELDLENVNRMDGFNENQDTTIMKVTNATDTTPLKVEINGSSDFKQLSQEITLEYYDEEPALVQDSKYDGYVAIATGKLYAVSVKYKVTNVGDTAPAIVIMSADNNLGWTNSNKKLTEYTATETGEYVLSKVIGVGIDGVAASNKLRLAFTGQGTFEIDSITVTEVKTSDGYKPVNYIDSPNSYAYFLKDGESIKKPAAKEGYVFDGWYNSSNAKITSVSQLVNTASATNLTAKWLFDSTVYDIDLSISQSIRNNNNYMTLTPDAENKDLNVKINSYWNNVFKNTEGVITTAKITPDAIVALKFGEGTEVADFVKLHKEYKYVVNVEYEVTAANGNYNPQIAIVKNATQNSATDNGTYVINANTHSTTGAYKMSAVLSDIDNVPLRLAFGGVGNIVVTSVTVQMERKSDNSIVDVTYIDGLDSISAFQKPGSELISLDREGYIPQGYFTDKEFTNEITSVPNANNTKVYIKWKYTIVDIPVAESNFGDIAVTDSIINKIEPATGNSNLKVDVDGTDAFKIFDGDSHSAAFAGKLWLKALIAIKDDDGNYVTLAPNYKYVVNVTYKVTSTDATESYAYPQIAVVYNNNVSATVDNGSTVLGARKISPDDVGKTLAMSAVIEDTTGKTGYPLRLAFAGDGTFEIINVKVSKVSANATEFVTVKQNDNKHNSSYAQILEIGSELEPPEIINEDYIFVGWFDSEGNQVTTVDANVSLKAKYALKFDANTDEIVDIRDMVALGENSEECASYRQKILKSESVVSLVNNERSRYTIVVSENATEAEIASAEALRKYMNDVLGVSILSLVKDSELPIDFTRYEILFGNTNRPESQKAYEKFGGEREAANFVFNTTATKIVIAGAQQVGIDNAVKYFKTRYCRSMNQTIATNIEFFSEKEINDIKINGIDISSYTIKTERYPSLTAVRAAGTLADFIAYDTGYVLPVTTTDTSAEYNIYVGLTTASNIPAATFQKGSLDGALSGLGIDDYRVRIADKDIFIEAGSDYAASLAVLKLIDKLESEKFLSNGTILEGTYNSGDYSLLNNYKVSWSDEFTGNALNTDNWSAPFMTKDGPAYTDSQMKSIFGVTTLQLTSAKSKGELTVDGKVFTRKDYGTNGSSWKLWTWGTVERNAEGTNSVSKGLLTMYSSSTSNGYTGSYLESKHNFTYGIMEARVMLGSRDGASVNFWSRSRDKAANIPVNEFDFVESYGAEKIVPNLHTWKNAGAVHIDHQKDLDYSQVLRPDEGEKFSDTFHYIAFEWTETKVSFYLDGKLYMQQDITGGDWSAFKEETFLILGLSAPEGSYNTYCEESPNWEDFSVEQKFDFIRVYQTQGQSFEANYID